MSGRRLLPKVRQWPPVKFDSANFSAQPQCPLLQLPAELRNNIFELALCTESENITIDLSDDSPQTPLKGTKVLYEFTIASSLSRTCKQIRHETKGLLQSSNTLRVNLPLWVELPARPTKLNNIIASNLRKALVTGLPSWKRVEVDLGRLPFQSFEPAYRGFYNGEQALLKLRGLFPGLRLRLEAYNTQTGCAATFVFGTRSKDDITRGLQEGIATSCMSEGDHGCLQDLCYDIIGSFNWMIDYLGEPYEVAGVLGIE